MRATQKNSKARVIRLTDRALELFKLLYKERGLKCSEDELIAVTKTGRGNTATNLEHGAQRIFANAGLSNHTGSLHIFRRTFATNMYEKGARVKEIAAYIGDLESSTSRYYIVARKRMITDCGKKHIVELPKGINQSSLSL